MEVLESDGNGVYDLFKFFAGKKFKTFEKIKTVDSKNNSKFYYYVDRWVGR